MAVFADESLRRPPLSEAEERASATSRAWPAEATIVLAFLALRLLYLVAFSSWELVGDEAHYWEWSRRPDLSYYTKGPGIAWAIGLSTAIFGDRAAAIRLPSALAAAAMAYAGGRLARLLTGGDARAAACAALALCLAPAYFATAQLATTDVFYSAAWMLAALALAHAVDPAASDPRRLLAWAAVGAAIGVGCLFKYTALLEAVGIAAFLFVERRRLRFDRTFAIGVALAFVACLLCCAPMIVWNAQHGWPTVAHQIGRLRLPGGDESVDLRWSPLWFPTFVGAQIGLLGVVGVPLVYMAMRRDVGVDRTGRALLVWLAAPILLFYVGLSLFREAQGNWAIAGYATPLVLVGIAAADASRRADRETFRGLWHWFLGIGVGVAVVLMVGPTITRLPGVKSLSAVRRVAARVSGAEDRARAIATVVDAVARERGRPPIVVVKNYQEASLLAFYLPGQPIVYCAASRLGARPNPYDYFADADLASPALVGRDAVLVGIGDPARWRRALSFGAIEPAAGTARTFVALDYAGPAPAASQPSTDRSEP